MTNAEIQAELREELNLHHQEVAAAAARRAREISEDLPPFWRVSELALQFPCLKNYEDLAGLYPFDGPKFIKATRAMSHGQRMAADFVMSVFNHENPFNVQEALGVWDAKNRAVFVKWATNPWWA